MMFKFLFEIYCGNVGDLKIKILKQEIQFFFNIKL